MYMYSVLHPRLTWLLMTLTGEIYQVIAASLCFSLTTQAISFVGEQSRVYTVCTYRKMPKNRAARPLL